MAADARRRRAASRERRRDSRKDRRRRPRADGERVVDRREVGKRRGRSALDGLGDGGRRVGLRRGLVGRRR
ncbi:MAG TPA: hypothetical protein VGH92_00200, partial [Gaiellaceae bacterium]